MLRHFNVSNAIGGGHYRPKSRRLVRALLLFAVVGGIVCLIKMLARG